MELRKAHWRRKDRKMKKFLLAAMMMGMIAVTPVMAHAAQAENKAAVETMQTEQAPQTERKMDVINWDDKMIQDFNGKGYTGEFASIDKLGLRMMIPSGMTKRECTQEEAANNIAAVFADEKNEKTIRIRQDEISGCSSLEAVAQMLHNSTEHKYQIGFAKINGQNAIMAKCDDANTLTVVIEAGEGRFVQAIFSPISDAQMFDQFRYSVASIQKAK